MLQARLPLCLCSHWLIILCHKNNNYFSNDIGFFAIFTLLLLLSTFPACVILNLYIYIIEKEIHMTDMQILIGLNIQQSKENSIM